MRCGGARQTDGPWRTAQSLADGPQAWRPRSVGGPAVIAAGVGEVPQAVAVDVVLALRGVPAVGEACDAQVARRVSLLHAMPPHDLSVLAVVHSLQHLPSAAQNCLESLDVHSIDAFIILGGVKRLLQQGDLPVLRVLGPHSVPAGQMLGGLEVQLRGSADREHDADGDRLRADVRALPRRKKVDVSGELAHGTVALEGQRPLRSHALVGAMQVAQLQQPSGSSATVAFVVLIDPIDLRDDGVRAPAHIQGGLRGVELEEVVDRLRDQPRDVTWSSQEGVAPLSRLSNPAHERLIEVRSDAESRRGDALFGPSCHPAPDLCLVRDARIHTAVAEEEDPPHSHICLYGRRGGGNRGGVISAGGSTASAAAAQELSGLFEAAAEIRRSAWADGLDLSLQSLLAALREVAVFENHIHVVVVLHEVQSVRGTEVLDQLLASLPCKVELRPRHGAGAVQHAGHADGRPLGRFARDACRRRDAKHDAHCVPHAAESVPTPGDHFDFQLVGLVARHRLCLGLVLGLGACHLVYALRVGTKENLCLATV
mmetsp:Transcript_126717/g.405102  ORF Transcript_126717/g.405102 Transcript_126717/m.405102 type:complete len:541 (-) Transcript_126717:39-1661(-)